MTQSKNDGLSVQLELPEGETESSLWIGVTQKNLLVHHGDDPAKTIAWQEGQNPSVEIHEGDTLEFQGSDAQGRVLVEGQVTAGAEKSLTIPVRRL